MDINALNRDGEWLELEIDSEVIPEPIRFKIRPITANDELKAVESGQNIVRNVYKTVLDVVVDWDFTDGDEKLLCTDKNKEEYMPYIVNLPIKGGKGDESVVGGAIVGFANNMGNFLKN